MPLTVRLERRQFPAPFVGKALSRPRIVELATIRPRSARPVPNCQQLRLGGIERRIRCEEQLTVRSLDPQNDCMPFAFHACVLGVADTGKSIIRRPYRHIRCKTHPRKHHQHGGTSKKTTVKHKIIPLEGSLSSQGRKSGTRKSRQHLYYPDGRSFVHDHSAHPTA